MSGCIALYAIRNVKDEESEEVLEGNERKVHRMEGYNLTRVGSGRNGNAGKEQCRCNE